MEDAMEKFFTYEERLMLQRLLKEGMSFKKIAVPTKRSAFTTEKRC